MLMDAQMSLTIDLGKFLSTVDFDDLPTEAVMLASNAFTDTVAVMMSGVTEPIVQILHQEVSANGSAKQARACFSDLWLSAPDAALINSTAAHAQDFDDQALTGHPSAILVPAILAEAETLGSNGRQMATAYVAGYEVWADLVGRGRDYHSKGWHPTSVFGTIGAAAAVAALRRLPAERASAALAIAASHASGLAVNFGTMTKPYHAGMSARNGLFSARLAASGATASPYALEHERGFLTAISPDGGAVDRTTPTKVGSEFQLPSHGLCVKRYPTCYFMHRSFDSAAKMLEGKSISADDVEQVVVTMNRGQAAVLVNEKPQTGNQARFSGHFAMAAAVILGKMGLEELRDDVVQRPDMQEFFPKVTIVTMDDYDSRDPVHATTERVVIRLKNGEELDTGEIRTIRGHAFDPLTTDELWQKFRECTSKTHSEDEAKLLFKRTQSLPSLGSTSELPVVSGLFASSA